MPDFTDTESDVGTWGGLDFNAVKLLIAHQRRDIGSCLCGWGVDTGDLGRSHALHVWRELQRLVLPGHDARVREQVAEEIAQALRRYQPEPAHIAVEHGPAMEHAAAIAELHRTTPEAADG